MYEHIEQQSIASALMLYEYVQKCLLIILFLVCTYANLVNVCGGRRCAFVCKQKLVRFDFPQLIT